MSVLLRGAHVITMSPNRPDAELVDVLVEGDRITAVGEHLERPDAEVVDVTARIIIPGLVNAHLHTWQSALRCVGADWTLYDYLTNLHGGLAHHFKPEDIYLGTLIGSLNQIACGTTTLGDWCHNARTPEHADAAITALVESGIRAVYLHGTPYRSAGTPHPVEEIDRLLRGPAGRHPRLSLGMAIQGPQYSDPEVAVADFRTAIERGLLASMHQSGGALTPGWKAVRSAALFGPHTNVVHGTGLPDDWLEALSDVGVTFTVTPEVELTQGHGTPITGRLWRIGASPSIGTDVDSVGASEVLTAARIALSYQRGLDHDQHRRAARLARKSAITAKDALSWATVEGARALRLADRVGRIAPGMQADLTIIDARALNLWPALDPVAAALYASIANIEAVMIAGAWRKRDHKLVGVDVDALKDRVRQSGEHLLTQMRRGGVIPGLRRFVVRRVIGRRLRREMRLSRSRDSLA
jgi:5-methylthioadenosine/S-adenosylhomocysteine deaminase